MTSLISLRRPNKQFSFSHIIHLPTRLRPAHAARVMQDWLQGLQANCPAFTEKNQWFPNSPDLNPLDYHVWGAMLEKFHKQVIWEELTREYINKAVTNFIKRLSAWLPAWQPIMVTSSICRNSVHLQVCILISSAKTGSFQSHPHNYQKKTTFKTLKTRS